MSKFTKYLNKYVQKLVVRYANIHRNNNRKVVTVDFRKVRMDVSRDLRAGWAEIQNMQKNLDFRFHLS